MSVRDQEAMIFGSTAGDEGRAGKLVVRVSSAQPRSAPANADDLNAGMNTDLGYALFPLRPFGDNDGRRGKIAENTGFQVSLLWRGDAALWDAVRALLATWAHLGCLGFRGRRAFGALELKKPDFSLTDAVSYFAASGRIEVRQLTANNLNNWRGTAAALLKWYRSWRQHGQMNRTWKWNDRRDRSKGGRWIPIPAQQKQQNRAQPGFRYARRDHNEGLDVQGTGAPNPDPENPAGEPGATFRPALGLPIIQFFSSLGGSRGPLPRGAATVNWEYDWDANERKAKGRFASPVILRPHRDAEGKWHALVIFVDAHKWPEGKEAYLNGQPREVSLELYEKMKADQRLHPFP